MTETIWIRLNGEQREFASAQMIADLVRGLGFQPSEVAVERNRELVPRARQAETPLAEGDVIEVVTLVGGG